MPVSESELQDVRAEISRQGFPVSDFEFKPTESKYLGTGVGPVIGSVLVTNTATRNEKLYETGHGSSWPVEFINDLRAGVFGRPAKR